MGVGGEIFVFDMGKSIKIIDLAKKMIQLSGLEIGRDIEIIFTGLRSGEKLYEELLSTLEYTLPTYHHKILISKTREETYESVKRNIQLLINSTHDHDEFIARQAPSLTARLRCIPNCVDLDVFSPQDGNANAQQDHNMRFVVLGNFGEAKNPVNFFR